MDQKLMLIINPAAGRGAYKTNLGEALQILDEGGYRTTLFFTEDRGHATEYVMEFGEEYDVAACIGGDGTLSEVITGIMRIGHKPKLAYFPMGTANDVATTLSLPKNDTVAAARRILSGTPHPYDVGGFNNSSFFAYIAGFGAFTDVSYATPQDQKKALGHLAYVLQGMASLSKLETYHTIVEYDEGRIEADLLYGSLNNSTSVGGVVRFSDEMVSLGDGMSELVLVKDPKTVEGFGELLGCVLSQNYESENLIILHTKRARFTFDRPVPWTRDGEAGGEHRVVDLCNYHAPIEFIF